MIEGPRLPHSLTDGTFSNNRRDYKKSSRESRSNPPKETPAKSIIVHGGDHEGPIPIDAVETALAYAINEATKAGQWGVVAQLAGELEARRRARVGIVDITTERSKRGAR